MATTHSLITLSNTTGTRLTPSGAHSGMDFTVQNIDATATVYLGGEGVTSSSYGFKLTAGAAWSIELPPLDAIYAISGTDGTGVAILYTGLEN